MSPACVAWFFGSAVCFSTSAFAAATPGRVSAKGRPAISNRLEALCIVSSSSYCQTRTIGGARLRKFCNSIAPVEECRAMVDRSQFAYYKTGAFFTGSRRGRLLQCNNIAFLAARSLSFASITIAKQALGAQAKESGPQSWRGRRYKIFARSWIDASTLTSTEAVHLFR